MDHFFKNQMNRMKMLDKKDFVIKVKDFLVTIIEILRILNHTQL